MYCVLNVETQFLKAILFILESKNFSKDFWLKDQIQRSSVSIASNIAEWNDRETDWEFIRFLYIARWSLSELKTQIIISNEIWYLNKDIFEKILENSGVT